MTHKTIDSFQNESWVDRPSEGSVPLERGAHVLIDLDNTAADFNARLERLWRREYPHIHMPNFAEVVHMKIQDSLPSPGDAAQIRNLFLRERFFRGLRPMPGFTEAVQQMREILEISFCTAPMIGHDCPCASEKLGWVRDYFGVWGEERCIITHDKTMVYGDVLIDDNPIITGKRQPSWKHVYFHQACNRPAALDALRVPQEQRAAARLMRWSDWRQVLQVA